MMKHAHALWTGLGILVVLPAFSQEGSQAPTGLSQAINETLSVLSELSGLQHSLEKGDARSVGRLLELTEPPILDAQGRDRLLGELRVAVSDLQMRVDSTTSPTPHASPWATGKVPGTSSLNLQALGRIPEQGLSHSAQVHTLPQPEAAQEASNQLEETAANSLTPSREPIGFSADIMRQVRLLILTEHPAEALTLLEHAPESLEVHYWSARALEKLGRLDAAIEKYRIVAAATDQAELAARAKQDLSFLEWKREFQASTTPRVPQ